MTDVQYGKIERPGEKLGMATQQGEHVILIYIKFGMAPQLITIDIAFSRQYTSHCYAQGRSQFAPTSVLCSPPFMQLCWNITGPRASFLGLERRLKGEERLLIL